jgi:hypothetical protein
MVNGAVYTPLYIREYIVSSCLNGITKRLDNLIIGDISCGCGGFFVTVAEIFHNQHQKSFKEIYANNIFGLDIAEFSITRTKIVLSLLALKYGEDSSFDFNLYHGDALVFDWHENNITIKDNDGFDIIIGNPPYVCSKNLSSETKELLKAWDVTTIGNTDLYIPFFQIGYEALASNGILGYITMNSFIKSLNGRKLRNYFAGNNVDLSIIDFGGEQVFKGRTTYTCICELHKRESQALRYVKSKSHNITTLIPDDFYTIDYAQLNNHDGWTLSSDSIRNNINKIKSTGTPLGDMINISIRNGFATLKNDVYVFTPLREDKYYYYLSNSNGEYKIERTICRDAIKPNVLKSDEEVGHIIEKLIFPYIIEDDNRLRIIDEDDLRENFPKTYEYLLSSKALLAARDKGQKKYEKWYAFGRNQALTIRGYKLFFPYISDKACFVFSDRQDLLFYNGYAIISDDREQLLILSKILNSNIFWYYIKNNSKPYSSDYYAFAKNYIVNFGICDLDEDDRQYILATNDREMLDNFLSNKYQISFDV